jgi:hypothetical protein
MQAGEYDQAAVRAKLEGMLTSNPAIMFSFSTCPFCLKVRRRVRGGARVLGFQPGRLGPDCNPSPGARVSPSPSVNIGLLRPQATLPYAAACAAYDPAWQALATVRCRSRAMPRPDSDPPRLRPPLAGPRPFLSPRPKRS